MSTMEPSRNIVSALSQLRRGLIVSCQAERGDPFYDPSYMAQFARAAEMGGASGIRAREPENIRAIDHAVSLPIIGLTKGQFEDGTVLITPDFIHVESILAAGADLVAVDGTFRRRPNGLTGTEFVAASKARWPVLVVADVSTCDEGLAALQAGADLIATTLSGYTGSAGAATDNEPDWELLTSLVNSTKVPVIFEGRVWTPSQARRALDLGAFAVVVGTAITRPRVITKAFVDALG